MNDRMMNCGPSDRFIIHHSTSLAPNRPLPMHLTLAQGHGLATMMAVAAVAVLLTAAFYRRAFGALGFRRWRLLLVLRAAAILLAVMLLFRPVLSYQNELERAAGAGVPDRHFGVDGHCRRRLGHRPGSSRRGPSWRNGAKSSSTTSAWPIAFAEQAEPLDRPEELPALAATGKAPRWWRRWRRPRNSSRRPRSPR